MPIRALFLALVFVLTASGTLPARAAETAEPSLTGNDHTWDCWVSTDPHQTVVDYFIRCIHDRDIPPPEPPLDSPQAVLLDLIHDAIHQGQASEIDADYAAGRFIEVGSYIRQIKIHQYPYPESWEQERPKRLVQAALCRQAPDCPVLLFR